MIVCLDVGYDQNPNVDAEGDGSNSNDRALAAIVAFESWTDEEPLAKTAIEISNVAAYVPGRFFERELPCLIAAIEEIKLLCPQDDVEMVIVDGNVCLDKNETPGLGKYLYDHYQQRVPVIGVAKTSFNGLDASEIYRGDSKRPLFVTSAGIAETEAAELIQNMAGPHRIPTLLKLVDQMSRQFDMS